MVREAVYAARSVVHMDTKISAVNLAMAAVLREAEPKSVSRKAAAKLVSVTEGQLNRLLGGNPKYLRDISVTVLFELAEAWGVDLLQLVAKAEARAPEFEAQSRELSEASDSNAESEDDFEFEPNAKPADLGLAANEGERKIDQDNTDDTYGTSEDDHGTEEDDDPRPAGGRKK